ncbi:unnamed protein product [Arctia plantaginis]|uniref:Uncharacterized protein n=1 Tax=Arctia plantaginis TaxID=874455 RepID=A0A8S1BFZ2_ARCPL|nr:unnamed protein product [Arctia plantaginis]
MARVGANSMPPVYNQPPLPTPSTSTKNVEALMFAKKTVLVTKTGEFVIAGREFFRHLSDFEDFMKAEAAKEALEMEQIALSLANEDMMQIDPEHNNILRHDLDIDVFDTLMGLTEVGYGNTL